MRLPVDRLEARRLLAYATYDQAKSILRVFGSESDDRIHITVTSTTPSVPTGSPIPSAVVSIRLDVSDGNPRTFLGKEIKQIRVVLSAGDDDFIVDDRIEADALKRPMTVDGGTGNDLIITGAGNDSIDGGSGADDLRDGFGDDTVNAGGGRDQLFVGGSRHFEDVINAGTGDDRIRTPDGGFVTIVNAGDGDDTLFSGTSRESFDGQGGQDTVDYSARTAAVYVELNDGTVPPERLLRSLGENQPRYRNNHLFDDGRADYDETIREPDQPLAFGEKADSNLERVREFLVPARHGYGGSGSLEGDSAGRVECAVGGSGDDVFIGSHGRDILRGGDGRDTFFAGAGQDDLYGDGGNDLFFTVDTRDAFPTSIEDRHPNADLIRGGAGKDFARIDGRDLQQYSSVEAIEALRHLSS